MVTYSSNCDYVAPCHSLYCDIIVICSTLARDDLEGLFWERSLEVVSRDEHNPKHLGMKASRISWSEVSYLIPNLIPSPYKYNLSHGRKEGKERSNLMLLVCC